MATYVFGEVPGNPEGTTYKNRTAAKDAGVHQVTMQGISGNRAVGANSVVVNGGYEDDADFGDEIIYTGAGGNDPATKRQIAHQTFDQVGNAALVVSEENGLPVRVIRGSRGDPAHSPREGLRYDGLYRVESHWYEPGKSGYRVCRYRLVRLSPSEAKPFVQPGRQAAAEYSVAADASRRSSDDDLAVDGVRNDMTAAAGATRTQTRPTGTQNPGREIGVTVRVVRDTEVSNWVKRLYGYACQVCDVVLDLPVGNYAEGAHIRPLGAPHDGPDAVSNVLCLCPTHHVLLDKGAIYIDDDWAVRDHHGLHVSRLTRHRNHDIDLAHLRYQRRTAGF